jgi:hypothetical protein
MPEQQNPEHQLEYLTELRQKYEEALSNAQKTGDFSKAEKLKEELEKRLTDLEAQFVKPEPVINGIEKVEKGETTYERAKEIMGKDFFGVEEFKNAFSLNQGIRKELYTIPYNEVQLEQAKERGEMLILRHALSDRYGNMQFMYNRLEKIIFTQVDGKVLRDKSWYQNEDFFTKQPIREGWALVSKDTIAGSSSLDYIDQTYILRDYLNALGSLTPEEAKEVTFEKLYGIRQLMGNDLRAGIKVLTQLKINQNHRRTPIEALYDFAMRYKNTGERQLEHGFDLTNTLNSGGRS